MPQRPRILSVVGARPNFMKVAPLHRVFTSSKYQALVEHQIVHTGQHYDAAMSDAFFQDLEMPQPTYFLGVGSGSHAEQTAKVLVEFEKVCLQVKPSLVIVVGDVNSTLAATLSAVKLGIPVAHVEAGLRSGDRHMPEELNRIATDALADFAFVTEQSGLENLRRENFASERMYLVGNTMIDSLYFVLPKAQQSRVLMELGVYSQEFALVTLHRPSNVDDKNQLTALVEILLDVASTCRVVFPAHPRTRNSLEKFGLMHRMQTHANVIVTEPQSYVRFLALMMHARFVMTDSGGVQEETTVLGVPCLTLRTTTERPITCTLGTNTLVLPTPENIRQAVYDVMYDTHDRKVLRSSSIPPLWDGHAAERIAAIVVRECLLESPITERDSVTYTYRPEH
ncbi:MAG: UDP-N-acetylglucosamine 2-epimerase (non-hydrolyzing) [Bacteroidota bacterium]|nr:UDP-N-acetylglucosamine 2-epimerase (non-hydrolyzing) [Candidatus Kapabacteria bacterium]MDW8220439.1 UDP-N-acetylglucosamine 2-epimerase (non-hydrolyzing) [Bacteroidota bacterium]